MAGEIQALFNQYQQRYPLYTRDAIVELMLDDGVITFDVANKIKSGVSLFLLDNDSFKTAKNDDFSMIEIMGGSFTKTKPKTKTLPKTNFNRKIEPIKQSKTQGDCLLLSDINALSYKDWGRIAIHDAIVPDEDGSGGVTIKFKGSPLKQKEIHITAYQIDEARKSGNFSDGDDDMIAFELAANKTFMQMVRQGLAERFYGDESMAKDVNYRYYIWYGVTTDKFEQYPISELLGIHAYDVDFTLFYSSINDDTTYDASAEQDEARMLKWLSKNKNNVAVNCGFMPSIDGDNNKKSKDYIHSGHAYAIKDIEYGKEVILTDPMDSSYEIKLPYNKFKKHVRHIMLSFKNSQIEELFMNNALPLDYEIKRNKHQIDRDERQKEYQTLIDSLHAEREKDQIRWAEEEKQHSAQKQVEVAQATKKALAKIREAKSKNNVESFLHDYETFSSNTIIAVLEEYPDIILWFDKEKSGWGNGTEKSWLITPVIKALSQKAEEVGVDYSAISEFEEKCYNEINAIFYTNEKVIQSEVEKMVKLIKSQS